MVFATKWGKLTETTKSQGLPVTEGHFGGVLHPQSLSGALVTQRQPE